MDDNLRMTNNDVEKALMPNGGGVRLKTMNDGNNGWDDDGRKNNAPHRTEKCADSRWGRCCGGDENAAKTTPPDELGATEDALYQTYYTNQKQNDIGYFFGTALLLALYAFVVLNVTFHPLGQTGASAVVGFAALLAAILFNASSLVALWLHRRSANRVPPGGWTLLSLVGCFVFCVPIAVDSLSYKPNDWSDPIVMVFAYVYAVYVLLPLGFCQCVFISVFTSAGHLLCAAVTLRNDPTVGYQVSANFLTLIAANILGAMTHCFINTKHRSSFGETKVHLKTKLKYEEHSLEQQRLLHSVLPEHVANEIRGHYDKVADAQFKKIYMKRHENVSILFADIVGFTAISSTYCASDLVRILNILFARFDKLAEKFHQLRIKILGDCYYCISGAPEERRDHAVLCVHMGLSMVEAIKYARETTKSPVDMRVGIHTGGILAGIMGQRQWQFDVYSKDVVLANKMESGGRPGRVHISENTLSFLNGEFEVEPGDGSSREEAIKSAGLKTYFIVKVLKPYPYGTLDADLVGSRKSSAEEQETSLEECNAKEDSTMLAIKKSNEEEDYNRRLIEELNFRGKQRMLNDMASPVTLCFNDRKLEDDYNNQKGDPVGASMLAVFVVAFFGLFAQLLMIPMNVFTLVSIALGLLIVAILTSVAYLSTCQKLKNYRNSCSPIFTLGDLINGHCLWRHLWAVSLVFILIVPNVINMSFCDAVDGTSVNITAMPSYRGLYCEAPQYFSSYVILVLLAITVLLQISHLLKLALIAVITASQIYMNIVYLAIPYAFSDQLIYSSDLRTETIPRKYTMTCMVIVIALALVFINRHLEFASRLLFKWKMEAMEQKIKVDTLRLKNEKLIYNILPHHVAQDFMGRQKQDEEMYSKSYQEVGVLFASMPNFSDFYSEESVNNQGLECLRFLNEVISDFDALLEDDRFKQNIIKIKTIGSTYMAASGVNNDREFPPDTPIKVRWSHLDQLTEFALALKETLDNINEQSFNHFLLRMGINHGPIIAGVIGARKPHYDMWGNTVNVASRMESTGLTGCIQVVDETAGILKEFGYECESRGMVPVKGKGNLTTYYVKGKRVS